MFSAPLPALDEKTDVHQGPRSMADHPTGGMLHPISLV
jgi:hypothetical protein